MLSLPSFGKMKFKRAELNPERDWALLIIAFFIAMFGIIGWSVYLFFEVRSGDLFRTLDEPGRSIESLDRALLKDVVATYDLKQATFETGAGDSLPDPSK